ncbi:membrane protein [Streptomyces albiaxialis]|uniref:Membrane protein n=1 Tax=Streptomyces albiaxialis TaxID=329523 RepID=A0ABN2W5F2_9ACTN
MTKFLLSVHVLAAILAVGPITVAASMFPRFVRTPEGEGDDPPGQNLRTAGLLHRICRGYTVLGIAVPVFGVATGAQLGVLTDAWLLASVVLTAAAAALLLLVILPRQRRLLPAPTTEATAPTAEARRAGAARLAMVTGIFNLLWAVVVVLMIVRPGSTTGA